MLPFDFFDTYIFEKSFKRVIHDDKKIIVKISMFVFYSETMAIMDRKLELSEGMDVALVKCCLDVLVDSDKIKSYQINYGAVIFSKLIQLLIISVIKIKYIERGYIMKNSNMRVIPMDDYAYLTKTKVSHKQCPICKREDIDGAMVIYGADKKQRTIMCNACLNKLGTKAFITAVNGKNGYRGKAITIEKLQKKQKCACEIVSPRKDGFMFRIKGMSFPVCADCFEDLRLAVQNYNNGYNPIYISNKINAAAHEREQQINDTEKYKSKLDKDYISLKEKLEREKIREMQALKESVQQVEAKAKSDGQLLVEKLHSAEEIEFFYRLGETDRNRFISQLQAKGFGRAESEIKPLEYKNDKFINSLFLISAFPFIQCSLSHQNNKKPQAEFHLRCKKDNYNSFNFVVCKECLYNLYQALFEVLSDKAIKNVTKDNIAIDRMVDELSRCYSCGNSEDLLKIHFGGAVFYFCSDCAKRFYNKLGKLIFKIDRFFQPQIIVEKVHPNYNERKMICKQERQSVRLVGYPAEKSRKKTAKFQIDKSIYPSVECECIGHTTSKNSTAVITTQRNDDFCLALCKTCADNLQDALKKNNYEENIGTSIWVQKKPWANGEHCIFCGLSRDDCNRIRIGSVEFNTCNFCKTKLLNVLNEI